MSHFLVSDPTLFSSLVDFDAAMPRFNIERVRRALNTSFPTATAAVKVLEGLGIVAELTGQKKNRCYSYQTYIDQLT